MGKSGKHFVCIDCVACDQLLTCMFSLIRVPMYQAVASVAVLFAFALLHVGVQPYRAVMLNRVELLCLVSASTYSVRVSV